MSVQRVPNFQNVTINGTLAAAPFNGTSGGVIAFCAQGTLDIAGTLTASGDGFAGGAWNSTGQSYSLNGTGGGGAGNWEFGGGGGSLNPDSTFQHLLLGSGGGGGVDGPAGNGGGLIYAAADTIAMTGEIDDSGSPPTYNGGGGSGGEVWLQCWDALDMYSGTINRSGGAGGPGSYFGGPYYCWPGGNGSSGLCRLDFQYGPVPYAGADVTETVDGVVEAPEPSTFALLGSALLGLGVVYLRRRRAKA